VEEGDLEEQEGAGPSSKVVDQEYRVRTIMSRGDDFVHYWYTLLI
jgi:hypothetical protein